MTGGEGIPEQILEGGGGRRLLLLEGVERAGSGVVSPLRWAKGMYRDLVPAGGEGGQNGPSPK